MGKHALLSASSSHRWLNCPPSARLCEQYEDKGSDYAAEGTEAHWLLELGELAGIKKMDVETVKSFITRTDDKYRPSYGRAVESHPRQCIIVGTTNSDGGFLRDITGNRRFWPVRVSGGGKYHAWELTETDQIWAEAIVRYTEGEELFLKGDIALAAFAEQRDAMENDDREGLVAEYLEEMLPDNWDTMDIYRRLESLPPLPFFLHRAKVPISNGVSQPTQGSVQIVMNSLPVMKPKWTTIPS